MQNQIRQNSIFGLLFPVFPGILFFVPSPSKREWIETLEQGTLSVDPAEMEF
ncbi:MAG: hypothetical protein WC824_15285 [Bacteroidota bacterium]